MHTQTFPQPYPLFAVAAAAQPYGAEPVVHRVIAWSQKTLTEWEPVIAPANRAGRAVLVSAPFRLFESRNEAEAYVTSL